MTFGPFLGTKSHKEGILGPLGLGFTNCVAWGFGFTNLELRSLGLMSFSLCRGLLGFGLRVSCDVEVYGCIEGI